MDRGLLREVLDLDLFADLGICPEPQLAGKSRSCRWASGDASRAGCRLAERAWSGLASI